MHRIAIVAGILAFSGAQTFFSDTVEIRLDSGRRSPEITWSDQMVLTPAGLATRGSGSPNTSNDFWIQTQPIAAGPSWRTPGVVNVTATLTGAEFAGQATRFARAWARYGADRQHWSSWFPLNGAAPTPDATEFKGSLVKPSLAPSRYQELMRVWWRTNPAWSSDEHEYCLWLAANHRDVFESEIPAMGYVQVLVEGSAQSFSLRGLSIRINSSASGLAAIPRGPKRPGADDNWFFDLSVRR